MPASRASSSRRSPGVRRRPVIGRPASAGASRSRRLRRNVPSSTLNLEPPVPEQRDSGYQLTAAQDLPHASLDCCGTRRRRTPHRSAGTHPQGGGVIVEVLSAHLPAYTKMVVQGNRGGLPVPLILGPSCIGRVL